MRKRLRSSWCVQHGRDLGGASPLLSRNASTTSTANPSTVTRRPSATTAVPSTPTTFAVPLHRVLRAHWPAFLERAEEAGGLLKFVVQVLDEYLRCGLLKHGLVHLRCRQCGEDLVVA